MRSSIRSLLNFVRIAVRPRDTKKEVFWKRFIPSFCRDDTFLDEELEENDFNFDNENEDALLAETDYDLIENNVNVEVKC